MCSRIPFYIYLILSKSQNRCTLLYIHWARFVYANSKVQQIFTHAISTLGSVIHKCMAGPQKLTTPFLYIYN